MQRNLPLIAVNGVVDRQISPLDRGFAYGDGVFETCKMINARIPLWSLHRERLLASCESLLIPLRIDLLEEYLQQLVQQIVASELSNAVVKIIVTRGEGGRGYAVPEPIQSTICIGIFPARIYPEANVSHGVKVRVCQQRLGGNTSLAGIKHLNRLEQVMARAEWHDDTIAEGLLLDSDDHLIEATFSNIFLVKRGALLTPDLSRAGVAGVMRRFIVEDVALQLGIATTVKAITLKDLYEADEVFLCNSIFGIWPVMQIVNSDCKTFSRGKITAELQRLSLSLMSGDGAVKSS